MEVVTLNAKVASDGRLRLDIPTRLAAGEVNLVVVVIPAAQSKLEPNRYDFSDFVGTLEWQGDAIIAQRTLRDEW